MLSPQPSNLTALRGRGLHEHFRHQGFSLCTRSAADRAWVSQLVDSIARQKDQPARSHFRVPLPPEAGGGEAFVKVYRRRKKHGLIRRLRPSRSVKEARGLQAFAAAGLPVVELLAWGERRRLGLWDCGVLITRFVDAPSLWDECLARGDVAPVLDAARLLAEFHRKGLSHGDAGISNFLRKDGSLVTLDLCQAGPASAANCTSDIAQLVGSALAAGATREQAQATLDAYSAAGGVLPSDSKALWSRILDRALDEARRRFGAAAIGGKDTHVGLFQYLSTLPPTKVLDAPCGEGVVAEFMRLRGWDVHVADIDAGNMRVPRHRVTPMDLNRVLPLPDASFDAVVSANGLHRLFNPGGTIREFFRILRPGGRLILNLNNYASLDRRLRFLVYGSIDNAINSGTCQQTTDQPEANVRVALMLPQVVGAMREAGFVVDVLRAGKRSAAQWAMLPVSVLIAALGFLAGPRSRRRSHLSFTNSMAALGGGNYLVIAARKPG